MKFWPCIAKASPSPRSPPGGGHHPATVSAWIKRGCCGSVPFSLVSQDPITARDLCAREVPKNRPAAVDDRPDAELAQSNWPGREEARRRGQSPALAWAVDGQPGRGPHPLFGAGTGRPPTRFLLPPKEPCMTESVTRLNPIPSPGGIRLSRAGRFPPVGEARGCRFERGSCSRSAGRSDRAS